MNKLGLNIEISVIIPYFNASDVIVRALDSLIHQTLLPKEVIIIDDNSSIVHELEFLRKMSSTFPFDLIILKHDKNMGAAAARNTGIKASNYNLIAFLDADDCWVETKLEIQSKFIADYDLLYSNYKELEVQVAKRKLQQPKTIKFRNILRKNLSPVTLMAKKSSLILFDERFRRCDDFKMSIETLILNRKIGFLNQDLAFGYKRAIGGSGLTGSLTKMSLSFLKACVYIMLEYPKSAIRILPFILLELIKFPFRCLKVFILN